jgi:hypothetical protein
MPVVFPKEGNERWPLPPDYEDLTFDGKRLARVNAASLNGPPDLEVAADRFFCDTYLRPWESGWYSDTFVESPPAHAEWVRDWYTHKRLIHIAPRGGCKTTKLLEDILRNLVTRRFWECTAFFATREFCTSRLGRLATQLESNSRIIDDFGKQKPKRGSGTWNRGSVLETTSRCKIEAKPFMGASIGTRPSGLIVVDDVEKSKEQVLNPGDVRHGFHDFFFNGLLPMARSPGKTIPMRIVGTLYSRAMYIYNLYKSKDSKITDFFHRTLMTVHDMSTDVFMNEEWIENEKKQLGLAAFSAQCLNAPATDEEALLKIHPELTTYHLEDRDQVYTTSPLQSAATKLVTHQVARLDQVRDADDPEILRIVPVPRKLVRPFGPAVQGMYRILTADYAPTISDMSDFSACQAFGLESTEAHPNTLFSLDAWMGKVERSTLVKILTDMAIKWQVHIIGIEAYGLQLETYERFYQDMLPQLQARVSDGAASMVPAIIPIKFPTTFSKAEKIKGIAWRFEQFRIKYPVDRMDEVAYKALWDQTKLFTSDMGLLEHDDILDTVAMTQGIAKGAAPIAISVASDPLDAVQQLKDGKLHDDLGFDNFEHAIATGRLTDEVAEAHYRAQEEQAQRDDTTGVDWDIIGYA